MYFSHINSEYVPAELQDHVGHMVARGQVVGHTLCYINSAINPLVYYFMSEAFKNKVKMNKSISRSWFGSVVGPNLLVSF